MISTENILLIFAPRAAVFCPERNKDPCEQELCPPAVEYSRPLESRRKEYRDQQEREDKDEEDYKQDQPIPGVQHAQELHASKPAKAIKVNGCIGVVNGLVSTLFVKL